jgi:hypothetical protein
MPKDEKGYITLLLVVLIAFGFLLSGALLPLGEQAPSGTTGYSLVNPPKPPPHQTLQLATLAFAPNAGVCDPDPQHKLNSGEPYILYAAQPGPNDTATATDTIKLWYIDELPLTLGEGAGVSSSMTTNQQANPNVGDQTLRDSGLPIFPALFLTDITNNPADTSGDAQNNGTPIPPTMVSGTWKPANTEPDIPPNYPNGGLIDPLPAQSNLGHPISGNRDSDQLYYSAEIEWNIGDLITQGKLQTGKTYRAQFVVHDGDQNAGGGDLGLGCTTIQLSSE